MLISCLFLAKGIEISGLGRRFAVSLLCKSRVAGKPSTLLLALIVVTATISLVLQNTATTAIMIPIGATVLQTLDPQKRGSSYSSAVMLVFVFAACISVGTPMGTASDLVALGYISDAAHVRIEFLQWVAFGLPITVLLVLVAWLVLWQMARNEAPDTSEVADSVRQRLGTKGSLSRPERVTLVILLSVVILWITPDLAAQLISGSSPALVQWMRSNLGVNTVTVAVVAPLFLIPAGSPCLRIILRLLDLAD